jgi:subtilisin family serine protease
LSLGYYDEQVDGPVPAPFLLDPILELAAAGVLVVTSAGNDATTRPMYPAAFAAHAAGPVTQYPSDQAPVTSVGATNPNGETALFSNDGDWVTCKRPGAALVSTFPPFNASGQASNEVRFGEEVRSSVDPDDFRSGFGTWSGTSFAAPVLAGELAGFIASGRCGDPDPVDRAAAVARGRAALVLAEAVPS